MSIKCQTVVVYTKYYGYVQGRLVGYAGDGVYRVSTSKHGIIESLDIREV